MFVSKKKYKIAQAKLELLAHKDIIDVNAFNKWFCDDTKPREIYANSGIFLRTDKLSQGHISDYWKSLTNLDDDKMIDDYFFLAHNFEESIRIDWMNRKMNNNLVV